MTENEAIELLNIHKSTLEKGGYIGGKDAVLEYDLAIKALEEIQQYRAIGTVEEYREAKERNMAKKYKEIHPCKSVAYYQCPCCDGLLHINENFCGECGQAIDWSETV